MNCNLLLVFDLNHKWFTLLFMISNGRKYPYLIYTRTRFLVDAAVSRGNTLVFHTSLQRLSVVLENPSVTVFDTGKSVYTYIFD